MKRIFFVVNILLISSVLYASPILMLDTTSVRGLGVGGCFTAIDNDVEAITVNPSGLASLRTKEVSMGYLSWIEDTKFFTLTGGMPISSIGVIAANVALFSAGEFPNYDENGNQLGNLSVRDFLITLGIGKKFNVMSPISKGVSLKIFSTKLGGKSSFSFAFDIGAQTKFSLPVLIGNKLSHNFAVGIAVQNLGQGQKYIEGSSSLPVRLRMGINYLFYQTDKIDNSILLEFNKTGDEGFQAAVGIESGFYNLFKIRVGYRAISKFYSAFSAGISADYNTGNYKIGVDYAMIPSVDLSANFGIINTLGLRFSF